MHMDGQMDRRIDVGFHDIGIWHYLHCLQCKKVLCEAISTKNAVSLP